MLKARGFNPPLTLRPFYDGDIIKGEIEKLRVHKKIKSRETLSRFPHFLVSIFYSPLHHSWGATIYSQSRASVPKEGIPKGTISKGAVGAVINIRKSELEIAFAVSIK
ncbi:hypothetical protein Osc7112_6872 (plasmid) [Oscillatoria nigro-viridis PCC 7112]|uniref:Uncharacterized protein n=1 Tax=Phormidium nigroviride PCC 7112 TaxID=179408 RepID=K9VSA9_9CYAN|nr:hypothetical protein Osc7112_6872 [Oscillatoria nigro-viridis PCC 7112]